MLQQDTNTEKKTRVMSKHRVIMKQRVLRVIMINISNKFKPNEVHLLIIKIKLLNERFTVFDQEL